MTRMDFAALTDHDDLGGAVRFATAARDAEAEPARKSPTAIKPAQKASAAEDARQQQKAYEEKLRAAQERRAQHAREQAQKEKERERDRTKDKESGANPVRSLPPPPP